MTDRKAIEDAFEEAVYKAWRAGLDSDAVDYERVSDDVYQGYDRFECAANECRRLREGRRMRHE